MQRSRSVLLTSRHGVKRSGEKNEAPETQEPLERPDPLVRDGGHRRFGRTSQLPHAEGAGSAFRVEPDLLAGGSEGAVPEVRGDEPAVPAGPRAVGARAQVRGD